MEQVINYEILLQNVNKMINTLEYDAMRSPGKTKMNSQHLHSMIFLRKEYEQKVKMNPTKKEG